MLPGVHPFPLGTKAGVGSLGTRSATCPELQAAVVEGRAGFQALGQREGSARWVTWMMSLCGRGMQQLCGWRGKLTAPRTA